MKKLYFVIIVMLAFIRFSFASHDYSKIKEGDIIFQELISEQSTAIKLATHSRYTHVGIIFKIDGKYKVVEALQPVRITGLGEFIDRGVNGHFVVKRLKNYNSVLDKNVIAKMKNIALSFTGKDYDFFFEWSDVKFYCSELVWKVYYKACGIKISILKKLKDFDLKHPAVKKLMKKRYGNKIPYNEIVVSPQDIFNSDKLIVVIKD